jgi:hypothetical protein
LEDVLVTQGKMLTLAFSKLNEPIAISSGDLDIAISELHNFSYQEEFDKEFTLLFLAIDCFL